MLEKQRERKVERRFLPFAISQFCGFIQGFRVISEESSNTKIFTNENPEYENHVKLLRVSMCSDYNLLVREFADEFVYFKRDRIFTWLKAS